jgi:hypothetical protein
MWTLFLHLSDGYVLGMGLWLLLMVVTPPLLVRLRRRWKESRRRIRVVYFSLTVWLCLVPLTLLEVGFALLYDTTDSFDMTNVSNRWFDVHVAPDVRQLAFSEGTGISFRGPDEFPLQPPDSVEHVVFLGDSFTFGHGVPSVSDRFSNILDTSLSAGTRSADLRKPDCLVSNLSWPGTDLLWVESVLQHVFATGGRIDRAVYVLCLNDIESLHDPRMKQSTELQTFDPPTFLFRDTYFYNWLYFRSQLLFRSDVRDYYSFVLEYYSSEPWERFAVALMRTQTLCRDNDCELSVVVFPFMHNLGPEYPFRGIHEQIVELCEQRQIPVVDLEPDLTARASAGLTVNRFDAHPNEQAHAIVAETIERSWFRPDGASDRDAGGSLARPSGE